MLKSISVVNEPDSMTWLHARSRASLLEQSPGRPISVQPAWDWCIST